MHNFKGGKIHQQPDQSSIARGNHSPTIIFMKILIPWLVALLAIGGVFYFHNTTQQVTQTVATLQQQVQELQVVREENERLKTNQVPKDELERLQKDSHEVLKLRNQVQLLRGEQDKLKQSAQAAQNQSQQAQARIEAVQDQLTAAKQAAAVKIAAASPSAEGMMHACINQLRQMDAAKNQWALENGKTSTAMPKESDIAPYIKLDADGNIPKCPAGGTYILNAVSVTPTCTIAGHVLP